METADLLPLLEQLDDNIDDLEESLQPILNGSVLEASKKLPVLDKAKFHVLVTYALESLIFCMPLFVTFFLCLHVILTEQPTCVSMASMPRTTPFSGN